MNKTSPRGAKQKQKVKKTRTTGRKPKKVYAVSQKSDSLCSKFFYGTPQRDFMSKYPKSNQPDGPAVVCPSLCAARPSAPEKQTKTDRGQSIAA